MKTRLALIGVGKLGEECGQVLAEYHHIVGYDIAARSPKNFSMANTIAEAADGAGFVFIAVPTPHDRAYGGELPTSHLPPKDFDYNPLQTVLRKLSPIVRPNQTIVVISTVLPGTIRRLVKPYFPTEQVIYNPYLIAMGSIDNDMRNPEMVIMGTATGEENKKTIELQNVYRPVIKNQARTVLGTWEEAESIKIFYNTFISAKIGLVNMVLDVAERCGNIDVDVVTSALRDSKERIMGPRYMHAGLGDGGACHPRDNIALRALARDLELGYDLFDAIMSSREAQAKNMARKLVELSDGGKFPIVIHGKAYKPRVPYIDGSYSILVGHFVQSLGIEPEYVDPMTGDERHTRGPAVFLLAHNQSVTYAYTGAKVDRDRGFYCDIPFGSVILDPWRTVTDIPGVRVVHYGNTRHSLAQSLRKAS
jgi:UDPglucose 6-dehydrogenase